MKTATQKARKMLAISAATACALLLLAACAGKPSKLEDLEQVKERTKKQFKELLEEQRIKEHLGVIIGEQDGKDER